MAHYEPPHLDKHYLQIQLFSSLVLKELNCKRCYPLYLFISSVKSFGLFQLVSEDPGKKCFDLVSSHGELCLLSPHISLKLVSKFF